MLSQYTTMEDYCCVRYHHVSRSEPYTLSSDCIKTTSWRWATIILLSWMYLVMPCGADSPQQLQLSYSLTEQQDPISTVIARLLTEKVITDVLGDTPVQDVYFQFISNVPSFLNLNTDTGELTIAEPVDRDIQCPNQPSCQITFSLTMQPVTPVTLITVTITIQDINDHNPQFEENQINKYLPESTLPGYTFVLPKVIDPDSPVLSVQRYELSTETEQFELRTSTKPDGSREVRLELITALDRETRSQYNVEVLVWDGGNPPKSGSLDITITVTDANDNHPIFVQQTYDVSIPENVPYGYFVVGVYAVDLDTGLNSQIEYMWSRDTAADYGNIFVLNQLTGEITVHGELDYEEEAILYLTVEARDLGADPIPTEAVVIVHIEDVNDHAPDILVHTLEGPGIQEATVFEGAAAGTFIARVVVRDSDSGDNGLYNCSISEQHFVLDPLGADFLITTHGELDREQQTEYIIIISCKDFGHQSLETITNIVVRIQDVNDNSPMFTETEYYWQITENNHPKAILLQVNATDADEGVNAEVLYSIQGVESQQFQVDAVTGVVKATISLDREQSARHNVLLVATDRGDSTRSGTATLVVDVMDTNDETPTFTLDMYPFSVPENEEADLEVGFVQAEDMDSVEYNKHTFSLQDSLGPFQISPDTGRISTTQTLDREQQRVYSLVVIATDTSEPYFSSSATVSVYVMDRNDNPPRFTFPTAENNTVFISNQVVLGQIITKVTAEDLDIDRNGRVAYEIVHASQDGMFTIDRSKGAIAVGMDISNMYNRSFALSIVASDNGPAPMSTSVSMNIVVNKVPAGSSGQELEDVGPNVIILVSVACISGILIVSLILAIVIMLRKQRHTHHKNLHISRMEGLKIMANSEAMRVQAADKPEFTDLRRDGSVRDQQPDLMMELQGSRNMKLRSPPPFSDAQNTYTVHNNYSVDQTGYSSSQNGCLSDQNKYSTGQSKAAQQDIHTVHNKSKKVDLSLEKSRQWLETLEQHPQSNIELSDHNIHDGTLPQDSSSPLYHRISTRGTFDDVTTSKSCTKNLVPVSIRKESVDSDSVNSGVASCADSGRGASVQEDVLPPRDVTYSPDRKSFTVEDSQQRTHGHQSRDSIKKPVISYPFNNTSSEHQHIPPHCHQVPHKNHNMNPTKLKQNNEAFISLSETATRPVSAYDLSFKTAPISGHTAVSVPAHGDSEQYIQPYDTQYPGTFHTKTQMRSPTNSMCVINNGVDSGDPYLTTSYNSLTNTEDDASSMSGSYLVDASAIVREIDEIFFNDVVV